MGGGSSVPDNSAQIAAAKAQQDTLNKKSKELQMTKEKIATKAVEDFNSRRRRLSGKPTLITTSEGGLLGSSGKLGN